MQCGGVNKSVCDKRLWFIVACYGGWLARWLIYNTGMFEGNVCPVCMSCRIPVWLLHLPDSMHCPHSIYPWPTSWPTLLHEAASFLSSQPIQVGCPTCTKPAEQQIGQLCQSPPIKNWLWLSVSECLSRPASRGLLCTPHGNKVFPRNIGRPHALPMMPVLCLSCRAGSISRTNTTLRLWTCTRPLFTLICKSVRVLIKAYVAGRPVVL